MKPLQKHSLLFAAIPFFVALGCSSTRLTIPVVRPAEVDLSDFERIAVGDIRGREGAPFPAELAKALLDTERLEVLDHADLERRLSANNLALEALLEGGNQEQVKEIFGATVFISGEVTNSVYDEEITQSSSSRLDTEAGRLSFTRTYTRIGTARMEATLRLVDLRTSRVVTVKDFRAEETRKNRSINDPEPDWIDRSPLFEACRAQMIQAFMRMITSHTRYVQVAFERDGRIPVLQQGFDKARTGQWQEAIDLFRQGTGSSHSQVVHKAFYNLGLAYLYTDQLVKSRNAFEEAYARTPEKDYQRALRRVNARIEDRRRLHEQGPGATPRAGGNPGSE